MRKGVLIMISDLAQASGGGHLSMVQVIHEGVLIVISDLIRAGEGGTAGTYVAQYFIFVIL